VLQQASVTQPPTAHRAVLVGTALSPGQPHRAPDGTLIHTLWGELAWQLGGKDGYDLLAEADRSGVSPGSDVLRDLFAFFSPCLILIDEWVAFVRQLYGVDGLPAGSFDANLSFAQALTDAARQTTGTLVTATNSPSQKFRAMSRIITATHCRKLMTRKIAPKPKNRRMVERSVVALDNSWPVCQRSWNATGRRCRCP